MNDRSRPDPDDPTPDAARAPKSLDENEDRIRLALDAARMGTFVWYPEEDRTEPDARMLALFGLPEASLLTLAEALSTFLHPDDRAPYAEAVYRALDPAGDGVLREEIRVEHPDGTQRTLAVAGQVYFEGTPPRAVRMVGAATDVTERKQAEAAWRRFATLAESSKEFFGMCDMQLVPFFINEAGLRMVGLDSPEDVPKTLVPDFFFPEDRPYIRDEFLPRVLRDGHGEVETRFRHFKTGEALWVIYSVVLLKDEHGKPSGFGTVTRNITERRRVEEALRRSEERHAYLVRLTDALRPLVHPGEIVKEACRLLGEHLGVDRAFYAEVNEAEGYAWVGPHHVRGTSPSLDGIHPLSAYAWTLPVLRQGTTIVVDDPEQSDLIPDAYLGPLEALAIVGHVCVPLVKAGSLSGALCVTETEPRAWTDTEIEFIRETAERIWASIERARALAALRASEERVRQITEAVPDVLFSTNAEGQIAYVSGQHERLTGVPPGNLVGTKNWTALIHPDDRGRVEAAWAAALERTERLEIRYRLRNADGAHCWVIVRARPFFDDTGAPTRWFGTITDVNALTEAEAEVHRLNETLEARVEERTEQVRQLASRLTMAEQEERRRISQVLHDDLQQFLYGVEIKMGLLRRDLQAAGHEDLANTLDETRAWVEQAVKTTRRLTVDLSPPVLQQEGLADALEWLQRQMRELHGIEVAIEAEHRFYFADADLRVLLFQVVRELLFNVKKHAGTDRATVRLLDDVDADGVGHVVIHVIDDGRGFDVAEAAREGDAGGFGLFSVRERLALLGGHLVVRSRPGAGTHVEVHAPPTVKP